MQREFVYISLALALLFGIGMMVWLPLRDSRRLHKRLRREFGRRPEKWQGLNTAERFYTAARTHDPVPGAVDDLTWHDLDMDNIYGEMNVCQSAVGDIWLYRALRRPLLGGFGETFGPREGLMRLFENNEALRYAVLYRLARLGRGGGQTLEYVVYDADTLALPRMWLYKLMAAAPFLSLLLLFVSPVAGIVAAAGFLIANMILSTVTKNKNDSKFRAVRHLSTAVACAGRLAELLQKDDPARTATLREAVGRFRSFGLPNLLLSLNEVVEGLIGFDWQNFFMIPLLCYGSIVGKLKDKGPDVLALFELLGEVDGALCLLSWRRTLAVHCVPDFTGERRVAFDDLCHPLLDEPVPASAGFERDVLLTGSNASGKSTFIKAVAVNCLFAQTIGTCTAARFELCPGPVATSMAVADNVVAGDSYFVAEIKSMARLVRIAGCVSTNGGSRSEHREPDASRTAPRRVSGGHEVAAAGEWVRGEEHEPMPWFFIDEILKGTNTIERIGASAAVLRQLANANCLCFAATHDTELTTMLAEWYDNYHFRETVTESGVTFDYKLREGAATTRNATLLLKRMDFPEAVTENATKLVDRFEQKGEWGVLG